MSKTNKLLPFSLTLFLLLFTSLLFAEESVTITTYYPSPYGVYSSLQVDKLGVGDNSGDDILNSADVPTTSGDAWVKGNVGIGTAGPDTKLHVIGAVCAEATDSGCAPTSGDVRGTRLCIGSDCRSSWQSTLSQTNCYQIIVPHAGAAMCNVGDYAAGVAASNWNEAAGGHENWVVCCTP